MPSSTLLVPRDSDAHRLFVSLIQDRVKMARSGQEKQHEKWKKADDSILAYVPESELDAKRRLRRENAGLPTYVTLKIPYSFALLMTAHTYWSSVFLGRTPVHQYSGRHGESEQQVQAVEALVNYQTDTGGMLAPYYLWLYDTGKYGIGVIGEYWEKEKIRYSSVEQVVDPLTGKSTQVQTLSEAVGYEGNRVYNVSPFDFYPDPRVPVSQFQRGEFVAVKRELSWNDVVRRREAGYYMNTELIESIAGTQHMDKDHSQLERPSVDMHYYPSANAVGGRGRHPAVVSVWEVYVDLIPAEWKLSPSTYPEKWCFTITYDYTLLIGVCPLGYMHGKFPFEVLECEVEAYGRWNRGIPEQTAPLQDTMDWLLNTHFYNVRQTLNNQFIVDPSRLTVKDFQSGEPGLLIRMKPEAYGQDIRTAFAQIPVSDVTRSHLGDMQVMLGIGERTTGINDQLMGMLNNGGRKTATEIRTSTGFGVNRLKTLTEYMSASGFSQHARKLLQVTQQYYDSDKKFRIVGDIAMQDGGKFTQVTPEQIAGDYDFVPVDGTLPVDRMAQANMWREILTGMKQLPEVGMSFDLAKMFGHLAQLAGIRNLNQFRLAPEELAKRQLMMQMADPAALAKQADKGNIVPIRPGGVGPAPQSDTRRTGVQRPAP